MLHVTGCKGLKISSVHVDTVISLIDFASLSLPFMLKFINHTLIETLSVCLYAAEAIEMSSYMSTTSLLYLLLYCK